MYLTFVPNFNFTNNCKKVFRKKLVRFVRGRQFEALFIKCISFLRKNGLTNIYNMDTQTLISFTEQSHLAKVKNTKKFKTRKNFAGFFAALVPVS